MTSRSLYQCLNAKVHGTEIYCSQGHKFPMKVHVRSLATGKPLEQLVCQACLDYDEMGPRVVPSERGWTPTEYDKELWNTKVVIP